jgi:hypothetical protein
MADKKISALTAATTPLAGTEVLPIVQSGSTVKATISNVLAPIQVTTTRAGINTTPTFSFHVLGSGEFGGMLAQSNVGGATSFTVQQGVTGVSNSGVTIRNADSAYDWLRFTATGGDVTAQTGNLVIGTAAKGIDFSANTGAAGMTSELLDWYEEGTFTATRNGFVEVLGGGSITSLGTYTRIGRQVFVNIKILPTGGATTAATPGIGSYLGGLPYTPSESSSGVWVNIGSVAASGSVWVNVDNNMYLTEGWGASAAPFVFSATYTV